VNHRTQRLADLVRNRARQRRHRLAPVGVSRERQVLPAVDLARCRARRWYRRPAISSVWTNSTPRRSAPSPCIHSTDSDRGRARRCPAAAGSRECPTGAIRASRIAAARQLRRRSHAFGRRTVQEASRDVGCALCEFVDGTIRPRQCHDQTEDCERQTSARSPGMNVGQHSLVGIRGARGVRVEGEIKRPRQGAGLPCGAGSRQATDLRTRGMSLVGIPFEFNLEFLMPVSAELSGAHDHE
jgi:hypothetical protein